MEKIILETDFEETKKRLLDLVERNAMRRLTKKERKFLRNYFMTPADAELFFRFPRKNINIIRTKSYVIIYYENTVKGRYFGKATIKKALLAGIDDSGKIFTTVFNGFDAKDLGNIKNMNLTAEEGDARVKSVLGYDEEAEDGEEISTSALYRVQGDLCMQVRDREKDLEDMLRRIIISSMDMPLSRIIQNIVTRTLIKNRISYTTSIWGISVSTTAKGYEDKLHLLLSKAVKESLGIDVDPIEVHEHNSYGGGYILWITLDSGKIGEIACKIADSCKEQIDLIIKEIMQSTQMKRIIIGNHVIIVPTIPQMVRTKVNMFGRDVTLRIRIFFDDEAIVRDSDIIIKHDEHGVKRLRIKGIKHIRFYLEHEGNTSLKNSAVLRLLSL